MNLSILKIKKSQMNASKDASVSTIEAPAKAKKPDYTGVPEAEAQAEAIKQQKKAATSKARTERKVSAKKSAAKPMTEAKAEAKPLKTEVKEKKGKEPAKKTTPKFSVVDYSEKSVALFGDTKPIKDDLKALGGRFNANLRPFGDDTRVPGWVFPKKCKDELMKLIK